MTSTIHEADRKIVQAALMDLQSNQSYKILSQFLESQKERLESNIFDEAKYNGSYDGEKRYSQLDLIIVKRNILEMFIKLSDDLIKAYEQ